MSVVWLFPGQSSYRPDGVERAIACRPGVLGRVVEEAEEALGRPLRGLGRAGPERSNREVQVAVFLANHLHSLALAAAGVHPDRSLGLSLGEYNHLVQIGALPFVEALRLVDARGAAYDLGPPGHMAAVFPLGLEELLPLLEGTQVAVANYNAPTQHVLAGSPHEMAEVAERIDQATFAQWRLIEPKIAMHHPLFAGVAEGFARRLSEVSWRRPAAPYLPNVLGRTEPDPTPARVVELLTRHVCEPVYWQGSVEQVLREEPEATLVEVGPGTVLFNLLGRGWIDRPRHHTDGPDALAQTVRALTEGGSNGR